MYSRSLVDKFKTEGIELNRNQLDILFYIHHHNSCTVSRIARELLKTNYNQALQSVLILREKGLIEYFRISKLDRRSNFLFLSEKCFVLLSKYQFIK